MKKITVILLCFVLLLSGCQNLPKAEPFYTETRDDITFSTQYNYYFEDESNIRCFWENTGSDFLYFYDTFELHILGDDGEWYLLTSGEEVSFITSYRHVIEPESKSSSRYELDVFIEKLKEGETYRISTFCFDESGNNYQFFAEFVCDGDLAEKEMVETSGGAANNRTDPETASKPVQIIGGND